MAITKLPSNATLTDVANKTTEIKTSIETSKNRLSTILNTKGVTAANSEKMSALVEKVNNLSEPPPKIYGIKIDESVADPNSRITYTESSVGITPATSKSLEGWKNVYPFNKIRLVGFKNGKVTKEINIRDKTRYIDGMVVPQDVDVMVEIPKVYWTFKNLSTNSYEIKMSKLPFDDADCYAHKVNGVGKEHIYIGAYHGIVSNGKLRSISNVTPTVSIPLATARNYAKANGSGYQLYDWYAHLLLQILYLFAYKSFHSQASLGRGYTRLSEVKYSLTGSTVKSHTNGELVYGDTENDSEHVCFLGVEDIYGNYFQFVDGVLFSLDYNLLVGDSRTNYNDKGDGYTKLINFKYPSGSDGMYITTGYYDKTVHTSKGGFFPKNMNGGSSSTHFCDYGNSSNSSIYTVGGYPKSGNNAGMFCIYRVYVENTNGVSDTCGRLMYV